MLCIGWYYRPDTLYKYQGKSKQEVPTREHFEIKLRLPHLIVVRSLIKCKYRALETLSTENGSIGWADCIDYAGYYIFRTKHNIHHYRVTASKAYLGSFQKNGVWIAIHK